MGGSLSSSRPLLISHKAFSCVTLYFTTMTFTGKYELETQENYEEFLEAIGTHFLLFVCVRKGWM